MCGIFGIGGHDDAANLTYLGLYSLQHRGQESAGIATADDERRFAVKVGMGHVADIFDGEVLRRLPGRRAIGHTRYSTAGASALMNAQPIAVRTSMGTLAVVHNGHLTNAGELRRELERSGSIFQTTSDTEVVLHLMARNPRRDVVESLMVALEQVEGAFSLLLLGEEVLVAARDRHGFRPLLLGDLDGTPCFASESGAFDLLGARIVREVELGEVIALRNGAGVIESHRLRGATRPTRCIFEHVYFARPDSLLFGESVAEVRRRMGAQLAREQPAAADLVVPVLDSGLLAGLGFSRESGLPLEFGLIRNHYVGRTFIEPKQTIRNFGVKVKLNPVRGVIAGRRVVLVDDSIVRGTTSRKIVQMVREAGAREVHLRISSPPTRWPCYYGMDTPRRTDLIAARCELEEIRQFIGADSLGYLSLEGLLGVVDSPADSFCTACWSGDYRVAPTGGDPAQAPLFPLADDER